jgi:hypothetical protein
MFLVPLAPLWFILDQFGDCGGDDSLGAICLASAAHLSMIGIREDE